MLLRVTCECAVKKLGDRGSEDVDDIIFTYQLLSKSVQGSQCEMKAGAPEQKPPECCFLLSKLTCHPVCVLCYFFVRVIQSPCGLSAT